MVTSEKTVSPTAARLPSRPLAAWLFLAGGAVLLAIAVPYIAAKLWMLGDDADIVLDLSDQDAVFNRTVDLARPEVDYVFQVCCTGSTTTADNIEGRSARQFTVRQDDPLVKGGHRSEIRLRPNRTGQEVWYRASIYVPDTWQPSAVKVTALQWHGTRDVFLFEPGRTPPLQLEINNQQWEILKSWDRRWRTTAEKTDDPTLSGRTVLTEVPLAIGGWSDWTFFVRWSVGDDGVLRAWHNGELVLDDQGPNAHQDLIGPYLKAGVYVPDWSLKGPESSITERTLFFGDLTLSGAKDPFELR